MNILDSIWQNFSQAVQNILPKSPFQQFLINSGIWSDEKIGFINWFVPFHDLLVFLGVWLSAVALYMLSMVVLRWLKIIGN